MIKNACQAEIVSIITTLVKEIVKCGEIPYFFNVGKILPLIKNNKESYQDLNNIRPITVSDVLANIFEKYVDDHIGKKHQESEVQFGFKKKSSTNHAVYVVDETIKYY
jgi:hypothetical protein